MKATTVYLIMSCDKKSCCYAKLYDDTFGCRLFISYHYYENGASCWNNWIIKNNVINYIDTNDKKIGNRQYIVGDLGAIGCKFSVSDKYKNTPITVLAYNTDFLSDLLHITDMIFIDLLPKRFMTTKKAI